MNHDEKKISDYIDSLNKGKGYDEQQSTDNSKELQELFHVARKVHSLKEPDMPEKDFPKKIIRNIESKLEEKKSTKKRKRVLFNSVASIAAILVIAIMVNFIPSFEKNNVIYAMEQAYKEVEAYHGFLKIVETSGNGKKTTQSKIEVWIDKEGHYYMKGLEGAQKDLVTVNNGEKKWQIRPEEKQVHVFPAFPDGYKFMFELGNEIEDAKNALSTEVIGEDVIAGRDTYILEVSPKGGTPYKLWIDQETKLPLQKENAMQKAIQYTITYTDIEFNNDIPEELTVYKLPDGFDEVNENSEQLVNSVEEAKEIIGFMPKIPQDIPTGYIQDRIGIITSKKIVKFHYVDQETGKKILIVQGKSDSKFKYSSTAILGKVNGNIAEIQSPIFENVGILRGSGLYEGMTNITSIRWKEADFEYAVLGDTSIEELTLFVEDLSDGEFKVSPSNEEYLNIPQVEIPVDLEVEEATQRSVDSGSSPWKLDPVYVVQVFISLEISPEGITGEYPIKKEDLKIIQNNGKDAIVEVSGDVTPIEKVYLQKVVRQDATGIWTVIGYDPVDEK
ncbi:LolA family protein [Sporosalibacterium faouarense]|uniref:LolA family protein n=1 Tax=Sporosalibacterium faouarense TaxID=516123 RepID=UPI00192BB365|nr:sigma-E factor regulatory protein RseB domain-containing protein [Sporosalibacterium faouarense]